MIYGWHIRDIDHYGSYPLDKYPNPVSYWIQYITQEKIKGVDKKSSDKTVKSLDK